MKKLISFIMVFTLIIIGTTIALADNSLCGIGTAIQKTSKYSYLNINQVFDNSPAMKVGLKPDDKIVEIDGKSVNLMTIEEATQSIKGVKGSSVKLLVRRGDSEKLYNIVRDNVNIPISAYAPKWSEFCPKEFVNSEYIQLIENKKSKKNDYISENNYWKQRRALFEAEIKTCEADKNTQTLCYTQVRQLEQNRNSELQNAQLAQQQMKMQAIGNLQGFFQNMQTQMQLQNVNSNLNQINTNMIMPRNIRCNPNGIGGYTCH